MVALKVPVLSVETLAGTEAMDAPPHVSVIDLFAANPLPDTATVEFAAPVDGFNVKTALTEIVAVA
jgi:hypothetical protein